MNRASATRRHEPDADEASEIAEKLMAKGKEARRHAPRSSHGDVTRFRYDRDPVELIIASNEDRLPDLIPVRHSRMLESPFAFFRGSAVIQAHDLAKTPNSGIQIQICGDCHLLNFGGFATPERNLVFDINDFDETFPGPWEWDVKRLAASLVLAARWRGFSADIASEAVMAAVSRYRGIMAEFAHMSTMDVWYAQVSYEDLMQRVQKDHKISKLLAANVKSAQHRTSEHVFQKLTRSEGGTPRIVDQPPLLYHVPQMDAKAEAEVFFKSYTATLREEYRALLSRFRIVDAALKVVGVGSVGTRCYIVLLIGQQDEPLFLQIEEARTSVIEPHVDFPPWRNEGQRVVVGQRSMQAVSDIFLGWARSKTKRDFYVRQLRDMKLSVDLTALDDYLLVLYGQLCGRTLARAHAKAGGAARIAGYLGNGSVFADAVATYAHAYADQVERDYAAFQAAASSGRIRTTTGSSPVEEMIA